MADDDQITTWVRLCDDHGMVSREPITDEPANPTSGRKTTDGSYLERFNRLRLLSNNPDLRERPVKEPFSCTGSMHVGGMHLGCTSPVHRQLGENVEIIGANSWGPPMMAAIGLPPASVPVTLEGHASTVGTIGLTGDGIRMAERLNVIAFLRGKAEEARRRQHFISAEGFTLAARAIEEELH
jgi:hypothetical protein